MTQQQRRILATGVFDILHAEHISFLEKAKQLGYLIVGLESDVRVRALKGEGRPINAQEIRKDNIEALGLADEVFILPEKFDTNEDRFRLLVEIKPDILAVSANTPHLESKARLMQEIGGTVQVVHQHNPALSTTLILQSQQNRAERSTT